MADVVENMVEDVVVENTKETNMADTTIINEALDTVISNISELSETDLKKLADALKKAKDALKEKKAAEKAEAKAKMEANAAIAEKYYKSLNVGDEFQYVMANGTIITAKKVETKSKSGLTAACEVVSGMEIAEGKSPRRFPKFKQIVLSDEIIAAMTDDTTETVEAAASVETE